VEESPPSRRLRTRWPSGTLTSANGVVALGNAAGTLTTRVEWFLAVALTYRLGTLDIQIHDNRILPASDDHGFTGDIRTGIDFLIWCGAAGEYRRNRVQSVPCAVAVHCWKHLAVKKVARRYRHGLTRVLARTQFFVRSSRARA